MVFCLAWEGDAQTGRGLKDVSVIGVDRVSAWTIVTLMSQAQPLILNKTTIVSTDNNSKQKKKEIYYMCPHWDK